MAMRKQGGGAAAPKREKRSGLVRPVIEDFNPISNWQQDHDSHILNIYLPGFMKEQIKVSTEGRNTIRVRGERLVAGNKWSRFVEDFQVPENSEMNSIRAKFQGGILIVTVPKTQVDKPQKDLPPIPRSIDVQKQPTPLKGQDKVVTQVSTSQQTDRKSLEPKETWIDPTTKKGQDGDLKQPDQKNQDKAFPTVPTTHDKTLEPQKGSNDQIKKHDQIGGDQRDREVTLVRFSQDAEKKKISDHESKEKHIASEKQDGVATKTMAATEPAKKMLEKDGIIGIHDKNADKKEAYGELAKEKYKKAVKGLAELNEQRQLLVNMGVALLVIVALTAQLTYTFVTGKDKK